MPRTPLTIDDVHAALDDFLARTDELSNRAWKRANMPMSPGPVAAHLGASNFGVAICDYASLNAPPDRSYTWARCPRGERHGTDWYFRGTSADWRSGACPRCNELTRRRQAWLDSLPTFAEKHPDLVPHLADPADASSRGQLVAFRCSDCGTAPIPWAPRALGVPRCPWCRARDGHAPGELVARTGGGDSVALEADLARRLRDLGLHATSSDGIVTQRDTYFVPVLKPDLVLPDLRVAVELDHTARPGANSHDTADGLEDDIRRDALLAQLDWRVLRVRRPDQATRGEWPWRVETTSSGSLTLARLIADEAGAHPREKSDRL